MNTFTGSRKRQDLGESSTIRKGELGLPLPLGSQPPRAPAPSQKRGGGPGPAGRRAGGAAPTPPTQPRRAVHCKQARGTEPLGSGAAAAPSPVSGVRPRTATLGSLTDTHTHGHTRSHASTRSHTHVETEEYSPWLWIIVVLLATVAITHKRERERVRERKGEGDTRTGRGWGEKRRRGGPASRRKGRAQHHRWQPQSRVWGWREAGALWQRSEQTCLGLAPAGVTRGALVGTLLPALHAWTPEPALHGRVRAAVALLRSAPRPLPPPEATGSEERGRRGVSERPRRHLRSGEHGACRPRAGLRSPRGAQRVWSGLGRPAGAKRPGHQPLPTGQGVSAMKKQETALLRGCEKAWQPPSVKGTEGLVG
ncbi:uncharacterized protein [Saccopteryx bilineata]|uniref:uncharacterized protein n=1 Tax=Saccopteryx bilineata TaxID=59482 RepID=UPI00338D9A75